MGNESDDRNGNRRLWAGQPGHGLLVFDSTGRCEDADELGCATLGRARAELLGMDANALFRRNPVSFGSSHVWMALRGDGDEIPVEVRTSARPGGGSVALVCDARPELQERRRQARRTRALTTLSESSAAVLRATDEPRMLRELCAVIVEICGYRMAWVGLAEHDELKRVRVAATAGIEDGYLATADIRWSDTERGRGPTGSCIRTGKTSIARSIEEEERFEPWRQDATRRGYLSSIALPLRAGERTIGALNIYAAEPDAFDEDEVALLERLADNVAHGIATLRAAAEHRKAELRVRQGRDTLRALYEASPDMIFLHGAQGMLVDINENVLRAYGYTREEMLQAEPRSLVGGGYTLEAALDRLRQAMAGVDQDFEWVARRKNGDEFPVEVRLRRLRVVDESDPQAPFVLAVGRDLTDRKRYEQETLKVQKLESLGVLAGGIAHDFNNMLTGILANVTLARMRPDDRLSTDTALEQAEHACLRARDLTRQLLTFAKGGAPIKAPTAVGPLVEEAARFALRGSSCRCRFDIPPDVWGIHADAGQIGQVIHNLTLNAAEAMAGAGEVSVVVANVVRPWRDTTLALPAGRYVQVSVIDSGVGIPASYLTRIFDPYFTTKARGSGLGLATCLSIVRNHQGNIVAESLPGHGARFDVYLPAIDGPAQVEPSATAKPLRGAGRILVMDDDEAIRLVTTRLLEQVGYAVVAAADGAEAIRLYREAMDAGEPFRAVILDLTVPGGMGGKEALHALLDIDPGVRALVASGYATDAALSEYLANGFRGAVMKPFRAHDLAEALARLLAAEGAAPS